MNALTLLKQDHNNVESLFKRFEALDDDPAEKLALRDKIIEHLAVHAAVEEQVFYPAVREASSEAEETVLESLEEHHVVKWTLSELEKLAPAAERFDAKMKVLIESVRHHVEEEENELFPEVRKLVPATRLDELGEAMEKAKASAPRRPHPRTPDTPPLNAILGAGVSIVDRVVRTGRDAVGQTVGRVLNRVG
jgi:hemerythrin superfamily protein